MYLPEHLQLSWEKTVPVKGSNLDPLIFLPLHSKDGMRKKKKTTYTELSEKHQFVFKCYHTIHAARTFKKNIFQVLWGHRRQESALVAPRFFP